MRKSRAVSLPVLVVVIGLLVFMLYLGTHRNPGAESYSTTEVVSAAGLMQSRLWIPFVNPDQLPVLYTSYWLETSSGYKVQVPKAIFTTTYSGDSIEIIHGTSYLGASTVEYGGPA